MDSIKNILQAIETRVGSINSQAILLEVEQDLTLKIGCVVDPTLVTFDLLDNVRRFNDEASNLISFDGGRVINVGIDNSLFMLLFTASKCNGGL